MSIWLIPRPLPQAIKSLAVLRFARVPCIAFPLSEIIYDEGTHHTLARHNYDGVMLTSARALKQLSTSDIELLSPVLGTPVFCVGNTTALAAQEAGFWDIHNVNGDGAKLSAEITRYFTPQSDETSRETHLLYIAGKLRAHDFKSELEPHGIIIELWERYRALPIPPIDDSTTQALALPSRDKNAIYGVLIYSKENARLFVNYLEENSAVISRRDWPLRFITISGAVANELGSQMSSRKSLDIFIKSTTIHVSDAPNEQAMLDLLVRIWP